MKNRWILISMTLVIALLVYGLMPDVEHRSHHNLMDRIKEASQTSASNSLIPMDTNLWMRVHASLPGVQDFYTEKRSVHLSAYPCQNCHDSKEQKRTFQTDALAKQAHWDIHLQHADPATMNCQTCHSFQDMNQLKRLTGGLISINQSDQLCAQCHSSQHKDWQGGAHGKSLDGWEAPRMVQTCVRCHNPHKPAFSKRFPARLNTQFSD